MSAPLRLLVPMLFLATAMAQDPGSPSRREALERAARELGEPHAGPPVRQTAAPGALRLLDVSLDVLAAAGTSTERDATLRELQGGAHDPRRRGFTLQQAELSLTGAVDPWLRAEMHLITSLDAEDGETIVELEEAFLTTQQLPAGLQLKAGSYFTEFGRINAQHPHAWDWQDQPVMLTRLFGGDGMRGPGARLSWLLPTDSFVELIGGVHNANGETMVSFLANDEVYAERGIGGRSFAERDVRTAGDLVYTARVATSFEPSHEHSLGFGASALFGPNATGNDGDTLIWGADFVWRWRPVANDKGWPFLKVQGEWLARAFAADPQTDTADPQATVTLPGETLDDEGGYLQALWGFTPQWTVGVRADQATGSGDSYDAATQTFGRAGDPLRCDRLRVSPLLVWQPSEFSRFRLQYNYDDSDHLADPVHSVWLGFEVSLGTLPSHGDRHASDLHHVH